MDIQMASKYMQQGYRIKRNGWNATSYVVSSPSHQMNEFHINDLVANDWEVIIEGITNHCDENGEVIYKD